ncbi:hypothetical protein AKJ38_00640 [candidate division MSBL1 archaeon SCGC-AAA259I14]|uniref:Phosphoesterase n=1 Tax=candidate division MSBL1 archaeon SCGC-AAA259I14 TaxID=1698268 RepID=A0A133UU21_9EURY|nr:hypothetical protein AKJ38_00640 [candidate division MSBL1 archaeon SCGC-AAA259I14]
MKSNNKPGGVTVKIGLMADTHDNLAAAERAVKLFNNREVKHVLHAGDLVSPFTVDKFSELESEFHFVWGNNEGDRLHVRSKLEGIDTVPQDFLSLELDGVRFALLHGTSEEIVNALTESEKFDVVVRGHTHEPKIGKDPWRINPGATSGYLADRQTVAVFDTREMEAKILEV